MASVLTGGALINCSHASPMTVVPSTKLVVGGEGVLTKAIVEAGTLPTCPGGVAPIVKCTKCASVTAGMATKLEVGGSPVLLKDTFQAVSNGAPTTVTATALPTKLDAI